VVPGLGGLGGSTPGEQVSESGVLGQSEHVTGDFCIEMVCREDGRRGRFERRPVRGEQGDKPTYVLPIAGNATAGPGGGKQPEERAGGVEFE